MNRQARKEEIRRELLKRRENIPTEEYLAKSGNIIESVIELPEVQKAQTIHCYISMNLRREVDTHTLITSFIASGKDVAVPLTHMDTGSLSHISLSSFDDLKPNAWGVLEPQKGEEVPEKDIDLVIVPMVGGDINGNRIGYGKGFYDRFLQKLSCPTIGLLFETCLIEDVPVEPFDVPLNKLVTEKRVIS